ncbi:unnamed protein product [Nippostrongylus brasiliensis]|uniref:CwfJ_C_2 domain-containing protein n=1 Tax=Nippostrongylus brasiliensis TaxID=27835 RepID=A0A0N4YPN4_NIPBR|nr:unnamed protein product [Nippostrongylus brasiliensis]
MVEIAESYAKAVKDGTYGMKKYKKSSNYFGDKRKKDLEESTYFECLQMGDGDTCTVKNARGEQILIHSADEVVVEPSAVKKSESQKVANFLNNLRRDPEWARSLPYVKLNATVPKDGV